MPMHWYAIFSKPCKEFQVANYLRANEVEIYLPTLQVDPVNPRAAKIRPYFPRYLFVHANIDETGLGSLQWIPGAVSLLAFDGEPVVIPSNQIAELKQRLAEIEADRKMPLNKLRAGDPVRIMQGPFAGYDGIFDSRLGGETRVQILLTWLGRDVKTQIDARAIKKLRKD